MRQCVAAVVGLLWVFGVCAEESKQTPSLSVTLRTRDGSNLVGVPARSEINMDTSIGRVSVSLSLLTGIEREAKTGITNTVLQFANGDRLSGTWKGDAIAVKTSFGLQEVPLSLVRSVIVRAGPANAGAKEGLILHYSFDGEDATVVSDMSGKGNNGTVVGATHTPEGKMGAAREVGRELGYVQAQDQPAWSFGVRPFSICLWFKFRTLPSGEQTFAGHNEGGGERNKWAFQYVHEGLCFHVNNPSSASCRIGAYPWVPEVGRWYHMAVTRQENTYKIYLDGACVSTANNPMPVPPANAPLTIGQAEELYVEGTVDEVMIFDRALLPDDVRAMHDNAR